MPSASASGWIDVHAHYALPMSDAERESKWHAMRDAAFMVPEPYLWTPEIQLAYMDKAGIETQVLSNVPKTMEEIRRSNDCGHQLRKQHPGRFGLFVALPTDDADAAVTEIHRAEQEYGQDGFEGFAVTAHYNDVYLSDSRLDPLWTELDRRQAVVFVHPDAYKPGGCVTSIRQPTPLLEVAFETTRTVVDMVYAATFRRFPDIRWIIAHCGAALPAMSGRLIALGTEAWVDNPNKVTKDEMREWLRALYVDTAATARAETVEPALTMLAGDLSHVLYGSDSGVPCSTEETLEENRLSLIDFAGKKGWVRDEVGQNALRLMPHLSRGL